MDQTNRRVWKLVVAGLLQQETGAVLLSQRTAQQSFSGRWELPGGKVEPGEAPVDALRRELREELGIEASIDAVYDVVFYSYKEFDLLMLVYQCTTTDEPRALDVADVKWVPMDQLHTYSVLPADEPLVKRLQQTHKR